VLYARRDFVLWRGFEAGQEAVSVFEVGQAVGRVGDPRERWVEPLDVRLWHWKYWGSRRVSREILKRLAEEPSRALPERHVPDHSIAAGASPVQSSNLPERRPPTRLIM
jgi:hypothetical protein